VNSVSKVYKNGVPSIIPVNLAQVSEIANATPCKTTHIIEDIDEDQDRHAQVKFQQEFALQLLTCLWATEFCVKVNDFDMYTLLGFWERCSV